MFKFKKQEKKENSQNTDAKTMKNKNSNEIGIDQLNEVSGGISLREIIEDKRK